VSGGEESKKVITDKGVEEGRKINPNRQERRKKKEMQQLDS
jgi:hypothetical protein